MRRSLPFVMLLLACVIAVGQDPTTDDLRRRALLGDGEAETGLGFLYQTGSGGVQKDETNALYWYRKAADQGYAPGQYNLGVMYRMGQGGVAKDEGTAVHWYRLAAEQGFAPAQNDLAWILSVSTTSQLRNPDMALQYALKAVSSAKRSNKPDWVCMYQDTLAEVYYVLGQYEKAVRTEEETITLLSSNNKNRSEYENHLSKYRRALKTDAKSAK